MNKVKEILANELNAVKGELIAMHNKLGMKASGKWIKSVDVEVSGMNGIIWGADYSEQLEHGRMPTVGGGNGTLRERIEQWIKDKGIVSELPISSLAYLIARKIHRQGWDRSEYGGVELISKVITPERIQQMLDAFGTAIGLEFSEILTKELVA